jgi:hypothetical protein
MKQVSGKVFLRSDISSSKRKNRYTRYYLEEGE